VSLSCAAGEMPLGHAHALTYPQDVRARQIAANGTKLYVRVGGLGPAVVLLHGYGETAGLDGCGLCSRLPTS
jgi:hypothetical protein